VMFSGLLWKDLVIKPGYSKYTTTLLQNQYLFLFNHPLKDDPPLGAKGPQSVALYPH
jgi:hypothetical protein